MVLTDINANHIDIPSDLVRVTWSDLRTAPELAPQRSEIQRRRHAEQPSFHKAALDALERGRQAQAWTEDQILTAICKFHAKHGRPPAYEEFRKAFGLPDYKTIWRKFGSSKIAVSRALQATARSEARVT